MRETYIAYVNIINKQRNKENKNRGVYGAHIA